MRKRVNKCGIILLVFAFVLASPRRMESGGSKTARSGERVFTLDITAFKDGKPVVDLTRDDLELFEDGKKIVIEDLERLPIDVSGNRRLAVILHDPSYWAREMEQDSERILDEFMALAEAGTEISILSLTWSEGLRQLQPFTSDPDLIAAAFHAGVETTGIDRPVDGSWLQQPRLLEQGAGAEWQEFRKSSMLQAYVDFERQRFEKAVGGIFSVLTKIGGFPGRKSLLFISDGLPDLSSANPETVSGKEEGTREMLDAIHVRDREQKGDLRVFDPFNIMGKKTFRTGEEVIKELIRFANAETISLYTFDPGTLAGSHFSGASAEFYRQEDTDLLKFRSEEKRRRVQNLRWLSEDTGALLFSGAKKYERLEKDLPGELGGYYRMSFRSPRKKADDRFHSLEVKVNLPDVTIRTRSGYMDDSVETSRKRRLLSAYYSPSFFRTLPFSAEFVPLLAEKDECVPWMSVALPTREFFLDRIREFTDKEYSFHFWIRQASDQGEGYGGRIKLPMKIDQAFMEYVGKIDFMNIHFKGPRIDLDAKNYRAVFVIEDPESGEIGAWAGDFVLPEFGGEGTAALVNLVPGGVSGNSRESKNNFSIASADGGLEFGSVKFFPRVTGNFSKKSGMAIFLQVFLPQGVRNPPLFRILGREGGALLVSAEQIAENWNKKHSIWSCLFNLDLGPGRLGENRLEVEIPLSEDLALFREVRLKIFN